MEKLTARNIIQIEAQKRKVQSRVAGDGSVHFWGEMPNSQYTGWYLVHVNAEKFAEEILNSWQKSEKEQ